MKIPKRLPLPLKILQLFVLLPFILAVSMLEGLLSEGIPLFCMLLYSVFVEQPSKKPKRHPYSKNYLKSI
jgi:hypothetical protein